MSKSGAYAAPYSKRSESKGGREVKVTTHLYLLPRLRTSVALRPSTPSICLSWRGQRQTSLYLQVILLKKLVYCCYTVQLSFLKSSPLLALNDQTRWYSVMFTLHTNKARL
jgi:hypothetical protein